MEKIQIILEAVNKAQAALQQAIKTVEKVNETNAKAQNIFTRLQAAQEKNIRLWQAASVAAALVSAGVLLMGKNALETADRFKVLAQAAGTTVEAFSTLAFAASNSNIEVQELAQGFKFLQIAAVNASQGADDQVSAFRALKVEYQNANGSLRPTVDLLFDVSDAFANSADNAAKTAVSQRLFGRSSQQLIDFLNQGSDAIREQEALARSLGLEISQNTAKAADQFSDNMNALRGNLQGAANQIVAKLLPSLLAIQETIMAHPEVVRVLATVLTGLSVAFGIVAASATATGAILVPLTVTVAALTSVVLLGAEAWKLYGATQVEAASKDALVVQQSKINRELKTRILNLQAVDKLTKEQAAGAVDSLNRALAGGDEELIRFAQKRIANMIRAAEGLDKIFQNAPENKQKESLSLPDPALEKANADAINLMIKASLDTREQEFKDTLAAEQADLDLAVQNQTITWQEFKAAQTALDEKRVAEAIDLENKRFSLEQGHLTDLLNATSNPADKAVLGGQAEALATTHEANLTHIAAEGAAARKVTADKAEQQFIDGLHARTEATEKNEAEQLRVKQLALGGTITLLGAAADAAKLFGRKGFIAWKAFAIAQAIVSTALAVVNALATPPPPLGAFLAVAAGAAGAVQIATIAATQPQGFALGGLVPGTPSRRDNRLASVASGEYIFDSESVAKAGPRFFARLHQSLRTGRSFGDISVAPSINRTLSFADGGLVGSLSSAVAAATGSGNAGVNIGFLDSRNQLRDWIRREGTSILIDEFSRRGNQVVS